ncbi:hypothetical protein ACHAXS_003038 [Conticribra weissflogii]
MPPRFQFTIPITAKFGVDFEDHAVHAQKRAESCATSISVYINDCFVFHEVSEG